MIIYSLLWRRRSKWKSLNNIWDTLILWSPFNPEFTIFSYIYLVFEPVFTFSSYIWLIYSPSWQGRCSCCVIEYGSFICSMFTQGRREVFNVYSSNIAFYLTLQFLVMSWLIFHMSGDKLYGQLLWSFISRALHARIDQQLTFWTRSLLLQLSNYCLEQQAQVNAVLIITMNYWYRV